MTKLWRVAALALVASIPFVAHAGDPKAAPPAPAAAQPKWQPGPAKIPLGHELTLDLPEEHVYLNPKDAKILLEKSGNFVDEGFMGIVIPKDETGKADWWVAIEYADEGYIKDDEKLDGNEILKAIKEGTEELNKMRSEKGFPPLYVDGWSDPPRYDKALHHLVWAIEAHSDRGKSVNFNTRILGRKGYVSLNLITGPETLAKDKPEVQKLLHGTTFDKGATYADFNSKTDKVAAYGLAALVAGGAGVAALKVAKIGLLAKFGKVLLGLLLVLKKGIILVLLAIGAFLKKILGGGAKNPPPPSTSSAPPPREPPTNV